MHKKVPTWCPDPRGNAAWRGVLNRLPIREHEIYIITAILKNMIATWKCLALCRGTGVARRTGACIDGPSAARLRRSPQIKVLQGHVLDFVSHSIFGKNQRISAFTFRSPDTRLVPFCACYFRVTTSPCPPVPPKSLTISHPSPETPLQIASAQCNRELP